MLLKSIKFQVITVLLIQFIALLTVVLSTLYLINLRQHDYLILNLTGQLRVITKSLVTQSSHYIEQAARDDDTYDRDLKLYNKDLHMQVDAFDNIIQSLKSRSIKAELIGPNVLLPASDKQNKIPDLIKTSEIIYCKWDAPARHQFDTTAAVWDSFHAGLKKALGNDMDGPRLEMAARYILMKQHMLTLSTAELANTFRTMMEYKLTQIKTLNQLSIAILFIISIVILIILYRRIFRPIDRTVIGFHRVADGDLSHQVPIYEKNEIGAMTETFNFLTQRLSSLFSLTDRINQTDNLDETLKFMFEEFRDILPIHWVGILRTNNHQEYHLDRAYSKQSFKINEQENFVYQHSLFAHTIAAGTPFCSNVSLLSNYDWQDDAFIQHLQENGIKAIFYLPLLSNSLETAMLVITAKTAGAYNESHLEFLTNIAGQVRHSFEKTIGMESLVFSTIIGLATLAENRDPETGDHLYRMSHYAALVAEEMGKTEKHKAVINANYIRDILKFAPMHDIGKVGINDKILLKPGKLDDDEFRTMQHHTTIGGDVLRRCEQQMNAVGRSIFQTGIEIAEGHHEKYDGSGYPARLSGEDIPLSARIVAVADVFDALTSKRPYKEAWPVEKALDYLNSESGKHFDPDVILAFKQALSRIMAIYQEHKHI